MTEKAITLLGSESEAHVSIEKVENINFSGRAISASKPGKNLDPILPNFVLLCFMIFFVKLKFVTYGKN